MKYKRILSAVVVAVMAVTLSAGAGLAVYAQDGQTPSSSGSTTNGTTNSSGSAAAREQERTRTQAAEEKAKREVEAAKAEVTQAKDKLSGARLHACEARKDAIQAIVRNAAKRGQAHVDLFTSIAQKVEAFYAKKGKTLSNYDQLVADVNAKKAAAQSAVDTVKNANVQFDCNGTNPKGTIDVIKAEIKAQEAAMQAYRTAVKNLIVGVKSVQSTTTSSNGGRQ